MRANEEKKNERKGMYISLGVHGTLLLLFFFLLAWREPDPPIPEYGIELNFGIDNQGSGTVQQQAPVTPTPTEEISETIETEEQTEVVENLTEEEAAEQTPTEVLVEEVSSETVEEVVAEDINSPNVVEEVSEEIVETDENTEPMVEEQISETVVEESVTDPAANTGGANQGDNDEEVGDQGDPEGEVDERSLYGNPGGGGGASLDMSGWTWDYIPAPNDQSDENGRIVFSITIDDNGEILSIRTLQKTVTPVVERIYKEEVERLTFSTTNDNSRPAASSSGTITFVIKSN